MEEDAKSIEKLRVGAEKNARTISELERIIEAMGPELEEKTKLINEAEALLKGKFAEVYETYKASLQVFGAEPLPLLGFCPSL